MDLIQGVNSCTLSPEQVTQGFLAAPPLIAQTIEDLTVGHPNYLTDLLPTKPFPLGNGTEIQQIIVRSQMPKQERGWKDWKTLENNQGCDPCFGPGCGYNWSPLGGYGLERKAVRLMSRDFYTPSYCVEQIQYTYQYKEFMAQIVKMLWQQVSYFKAFNINFNAITDVAKKFVVDSSGPKINLQNPYVYPNIGTARISNFNIYLCRYIYQWMVKSTGAMPYLEQDGRPVYAVMASDETLAGLYPNDPNLRQDIRFSGQANDLITKYNFTYTIQGMFLPAPILFPRRFNFVAGVPVEVLPFVDGIPMEIGSFTGVNPAYEAATHEEVIFHGKDPFAVYVGQTETSLGGGTDFGPEPNFLNWFKWSNPETPQDPFRRVGRFVNSIKIGIQQMYSDGVFAFLVERVPQTIMFQVNPAPICPTPVTPCTNLIPDSSCPCPLVDSVTFDPINEVWIVKLTVPVTVLPDDTITFQLESGGVVSGTVVGSSTDGFYVSLTWDDATFEPGSCNQLTYIGTCNNQLSCSAFVMSASDCRAGVDNALLLTLSNPIVATTVGQDILVYFGDGTSALMDITAINQAANLWTVQFPGGVPTVEDILCQRKGVTKVCVPPATVATCPACDPIEIAQCEEPIA